MPGKPLVWAAVFALFVLPQAVSATTFDPRALAALGPPARASGRVAEARSSRDTDGVLRTHVVLVDAQGRETARFSALGGVEGRVRWVAEGVPTFALGEEVTVPLT